MHSCVFLRFAIVLGTYELFSTAPVPECLDCGCCMDGTCSTEYVTQVGGYVDDVCTKGCIDGISGRRCYNKCPNGCSTCEQYSRKTCTGCAPGYYLTSYKTCSACSTNCKSCTSQTECQACNSPYYNDGEITNCSLSCPEQCLCESFKSISCDQCASGYFGLECNTPCPSTHCTNNTCERNTGKCLSCPNGMYGSFCELECASGCLHATCDVKTGSCLECLPSYSGDKCCVQNGFCQRCSTNTVCEICVDGYYGIKCEKPCPATCQIKGMIQQCDRTKGACLRCSDGYHGDYCNLTCSRHCLNNTCHQHNGQCSGGCIECYGGPSCNDVTCYSDHLIGIAIGSSAAAIITILATVIISSIFIMRRWKKKMIRERPEGATAERSYVNSEFNLVSSGISNSESEVDLRDRKHYEDIDERSKDKSTVYDELKTVSG